MNKKAIKIGAGLCSLAFVGAIVPVSANAAVSANVTDKINEAMFKVVDSVNCGSADIEYNFETKELSHSDDGGLTWSIESVEGIDSVGDVKYVESINLTNMGESISLIDAEFSDNSQVKFNKEIISE